MCVYMYNFGIIYDMVYELYDDGRASLSLSLSRDGVNFKLEVGTVYVHVCM